MIGSSLVAEGFGFHIPKRYLYAAIGFSIAIESFNQFAQRNKLKREDRLPLRDRNADAILRLLGGRSEANVEDGDAVAESPFAVQERSMVSGVLTIETDAFMAQGVGHTSVARYILERFATMPRPGEALEAHGFRFEVIEMVDRRIERVKVNRIESAPGDNA
jgi:CBS domain containing-hemolysin-like protein